MYNIKAPVQLGGGTGRGCHTISVIPPHEALDETFADEDRRELRQAIEDNDLPPCYYTHPLVVANPGVDVFPLAIYLDGVPYSNVDSVIGVWVVNIVNRRRLLSVALRKRLLCRCGCRGWCTLWPVFQFIMWSCNALAEGRHPAIDHLNKPWTNKTRGIRGNALMHALYAVLFIKGDWSEYAGTLGFPAWNHGLRPCFACNVTRAGMADHADVGPASAGPFRENLMGEYEEACSACEVIVLVDAARHASIMAAGLQFDRRDGGSKGLSLTADVFWDGELQLQRGDRLEPSTELPDVAAFPKIAVFPLTITFWRQSHETMTRHRNPLFAIVGVSLVRSLTVDMMHSLHLGVMLLFCRLVLWYLLMEGLWCRKGNQEEIIETGSQVLRMDLDSWYKARHQQFPTERLTRADMTRKKIGDAADRKLKTKAAETWGVLLYLVDKLRVHKARFGPTARRYYAAGSALVQLMKVLDESSVVMTSTQIRDAFAAYQRYLALTDGIEELRGPKRHILLHMLRQMPVQGNPKRYANWYDETLNRLLKLACRTTSQLTFETSVLLRMQVLLDNEFQRGRKRK